MKELSVFLNNYLTPLKCYFLFFVFNIPKRVEEHEIIVRGVLAPMFYSRSKERLNDVFFMPPLCKDVTQVKPKHKEVSVLRYTYTNINRCKRFAKKIKIDENNYIGIATFKKETFDQLKEKNFNIPKEEPFTISLLASPLLRAPYHADIMYSEHNVKGEPNTIMRKVAKEICKITTFFIDNTPDNPHWGGDNIDIHYKTQ